MYCYKPLLKINNEILKRQLLGKSFISYKHFKEKKNLNKYLKIGWITSYPCGSCFNCINMNRYHWVKKMEIEKKQWKFTYFITLTYNDNNYPFDGSLKVSDVQKFIKYLRKFIHFRYFCCGEYGSITHRPHYHMIMFTNNELELRFLKQTKTGVLFDCELLNKCWLYKGFIWVAYDFNSMSFAYVSSYSNKSYLKQSQNLVILDFEKKKNEILINDEIQGFKKYIEIDKLIPMLFFKKNEFIIMSKKPPLGSNLDFLEIKEAPSSLLKWKDTQLYKEIKNDRFKLDEIESFWNNPYSKELSKRLEDYELFLKNNNLRDIIDNSDLLKNKKISKKSIL